MWIVLALVVSVLPATAAEEIHTYDVAIVLAPDGSAEITETIAASVEGKQILRGLLRNIPRVVVGDNGVIRDSVTTVLSVTRNGEPERFAVEEEPSRYVVRMGKAEVFLEHAVHTWELRYRMSALVGPDGSNNALAVEPISSGWPFPILKASLTVTLPPGSRVVKRLARIGTAVGTLAGTWTEVSPTELAFTPSKPVGDLTALSVVVLFTGGLTQ